MNAEKFIGANINTGEADSGSEIPNLECETQHDIFDPDYEYITKWQMSDKQYFEIQKKKGGE